MYVCAYVRACLCFRRRALEETGEFAVESDGRYVQLHTPISDMGVIHTPSIMKPGR